MYGVKIKVFLDLIVWANKFYQNAFYSRDTNFLRIDIQVCSFLGWGNTNHVSNVKRNLLYLQINFPPNIMQYANIKSEDDSPPPMDTNPLNGEFSF